MQCQLRILRTDGCVQTFSGHEQELEVLRNRLIFAMNQDPEAIIMQTLSTQSVEIQVPWVSAVGRVETEPDDA